MDLRKGIILCLLAFIVSSQIISRPIRTTFTEFGGFKAFQIQWKVISDVCSTCLLEVTFPEIIHIDSTPLVYSLSDQNGVMYLEGGGSMAPTSTIYYFRINQVLPANIWYIITIYPTQPPTLVSGLIGIRIIAGIASSNIAYLSNSAFEYYHIGTTALPPANLIVGGISSFNTQASQIYPYQVSFSSTSAYSDEILLTFLFTNQIYSSLSASTPLLQNNNFNFIGSCQLICSNISCVNPFSCIIRNNQILLLLPYLPASTTFTLQTTILNPSFIDTTGIAVQIKSNAVISGLGIANNVFTVTPISIVASGVNLHWGIPLNVVQNTMGLGLFVDGGWNTVDVGFTVSQITMIGTQFRVELYVGASSVLQQSVNTNLPSLNGTSSMRCLYALPYLQCSPVDAFTSTSLRYFIKFKAYISSADNIASLGSIRILLLNSNNMLFNGLAQSLSIPKIPCADYRDYSGFHSNSYKIKETQVIGIPDTGLTNSTSTFMNNFYTSNTSFVGIDPEVPTQQLIFLLKTIPSQMSKAITNQTYEMKVYINPQVFSSIGTQGLDVAAFDQNSNSYRGDAVSCYVNSSTSPTIQIYQCQAYKDYVYGLQIDNTYTNAAYYGVFSFVCGSGQVVVCPTGQSCAQSCRIFKGKNNLNGYSGVFSIRNAVFTSGYQSTYLANEKTLDFIIAFYHGGVLVTASLINAYTIKQARLSNLGVNFYNTYLSITSTNDGARVPNLFALTGHLSIQEINGINYDEFVLFLPQEVSINKYVEPTGRVGCTHTCISNKNYNSITLCQDNWICKQKISIKGVANFDSSIDFKMPVVISSTIIGSFDLAFLSSNSIVKIYRISGSAITDFLSPAATPLISINSYANAWTNDNYWVKTATDTYKQGINLNSLVQFSALNTIDMQGSVLTYTGSPFLTFTSVSMSIFSAFTTALGNNLLPCNSPFYYTYNSQYNVTVLWCPLLSGATNQVTINYPFYSLALGANFPFSTIFAYGFSDGAGNLVAYRTQSNSKTAKDICTTSHVNSFNYGDSVQQLVSISLSMNAITLASGYYSSVQIIISIPAQVPVGFVLCSVTETLVNQAVSCNIASSASNVGTLQLTSSNSITIMSLQISLWIFISGTPSVLPLNVYYYSVNVRLPQTDSLGNPAIYGSSYLPFFSDIAGCGSIMNLITTPAISQPIIINNISSTAIALGFLSDLSFTLKFYITRADILWSSEIDIEFTNAVTTSTTSCSFWTPQNYIFLQEIITGTGVRLKPLEYETPFTFTTYQVTCKNLIIQQNSIIIYASWIDAASILQQSLTTLHNLNLPAASTISGSVASKIYNTLAYDSKFILSLALPTISNDNVEIWIDVSNYEVHDVVLECFYQSNSLNLQIYCTNDWPGKIHLVFTAVTASIINFSIYGIRQKSINAITFKTLIQINQIQNYICTMTDSVLPNIVSAQPIAIKSELVDSNFCLSLTISFPVAYSSTLYVELDDTFVISLPLTLNCSIDNISQTCTRAAPNLIAISSTFAFLANADHYLSICRLTPTKLDRLDSEQIHFKVFTLSGSSINIGSYENLLHPYFLSNLPTFPMQLLAWSQLNFNTSWVYHTIYIGYYKNPIYLSSFNQSIFTQNFLLSSTSYHSQTYINSSNNVLMGTFECQFDLAASQSNVNKIDYLMVAHSSLQYYQPSPLPLFISNEKCSITSEFSLYETYPGGITLPILLDFSQCRPAATHFLSYSINSAELAIDSSLTNQQVNATYPQAYIFVRQMPFNPQLSGIFTLQIAFTGPYSTSFIVTPTLNIKINAGTILQIPQSLPPVIAYQNSSFINLTLQCNQPSAIYWALGFYPTILGITYEVIQSQLISGQQGMRSRVYDPYSWSKQIYGIDYESYSNKNKTLLINNLNGNSNYIFKYFCVNQLGFASGGQIINFTTGATDYGLNKVQIRFSNELTISQANLMACYIAEVLLTAYATVTTSTFSNCINTSFSYYPTANTTYYDEKKDNLYSYFFYIDSQTRPTTHILSILPSNLPIFPSLIKNIPPYSSISIVPLMNAYDPLVVNSSFSVGSSVVSCTVNVGVVSSYLVLAYMSQAFDPLTMTIPPQYLIKEGNFSAVSQFNQVYMKYGSNNITINITGLSQYSNYSIFYFVTVDNPALNSKPTKVYYQNIITSAFVTYDLNSPTLQLLLLSLVCLLGAML